MTSDKSPATDQLRRRVEATREELRRTVAVLTAKNDDQGTLVQRAGRTGAKAHEAASRIRDLVRTKTPEPLRGRAVRAALRTRRQAAHAGRLARAKAPAALRAGAGRTARTARAHRAPLLGAGAALGVFLFLRRARRRG